MISLIVKCIQYNYCKDYRCLKNRCYFDKIFKSYYNRFVSYDFMEINMDFWEKEINNKINDCNKD